MKKLFTLMIVGTSLMASAQSVPDAAVTQDTPPDAHEVSSDEVQSGYGYVGTILFDNEKDGQKGIPEYAYDGTETDWFASTVAISRIGSYAFNDAKALKIVSFVDYVDAIDAHAFAGCDNLNYILFAYADDGATCRAKVPAVTAETFDGLDLDNLVVMVPEEVYDDFKADPVWGTLPYLGTYEKQGHWLTVRMRGVPCELYSFKNSDYEWYKFCDGGVIAVAKFPFYDCHYCMLTPSSKYFHTPDVDVEVPAQVEICDKEAGRIGVEPGTRYDIVGIGEQLFWGTEVTGVTLPNTVREIEPNAFRHALKLETVRLGSGIQRIGHGAFNRCVSLRTVEVTAAEPPVVEDANVFYGVDLAAATLIVPDASVEAYAAAPHWRDFGLIMKYSDIYGAVSAVSADADADAPVYYTIDGRRVITPTHGLYIVRRGDTVTREIFR